jgi:hypothetical protein
MRRTLRLLVLLLAVGAVGVVIGRSVAPPAPPLTRAEVERIVGLDRVIADVDFRQTPFEEAVEFLRNKSGVNVTAKWRELESAGIDRNTPITLRVANLPLKRVLELVCDEAGGGSTVVMDTREHDGAVVISTRDDNARYAVVRLYDVQDLIRTHYDSRVQLGWRPPPTANSGGSGGGSSGFGSGYPQEPHVEAVETLTRMITEYVAPYMWRDNGGTIGNIREINGRLLITATPQMHEEIGALLELIRKGE